MSILYLFFNLDHSDKEESASGNKERLNNTSISDLKFKNLPNG